MTTMEQDADTYRAEQSAAATAFRIKHPVEWKSMNDGTMGTYTAKPGQFRQLVAYLDRKAAEAGGFPSFAVWLNRKYPHSDAA
jgi:hypothetical protein